MAKRCKHLDSDGVCPLSGTPCYFEDLENCRNYEPKPPVPRTPTVQQAREEGQPDLFA